MSLLAISIKRYLGIIRQGDLSQKKTMKFGDPSEVSEGRIYSVISVITILILWSIVCKMEVVPALFLPSPLAVLKKFWIISIEGYRGHTLFGHFLISAYRVLAGFLLGCIAGGLSRFQCLAECDHCVGHIFSFNHDHDPPIHFPKTADIIVRGVG